MSDSTDETTGEPTREDKPQRASQPAIPIVPDFGPRYRVLNPIGKGGMGEVFRAYDTELRGEVALKTVRADVESQQALDRFRREIALARKITNPNVLRVYDLAEHQGLRFLSMEYVEGEDLGALMRRERLLTIERATDLFRQVCVGISAAHAQGVVHRDLKPQNVLVGGDGQVRVADFGLARSIAESGLTASGAIMGSPAYMSPEQVKGVPTDERSDIYSLGIMLYQLVTGETPFRGDTPHAVMEMRLHKKPRLLREVRPETPANLEAICARCLEIVPSARYGSVRELLAMLDADTVAVGARPARPRRWWLAAVAGGALAAAGTIAALAWPRGGAAPPPAPAPAVSPPADIPKDGLATVLVLPFDNRTTDPVFDATLETVVASALKLSRVLDPFVGDAVQDLVGDTPGDLETAGAAAIARRDHARVITVRGSVASKGGGFTITMWAREAGTGSELYRNAVDVPSLAAVVPAIAGLAAELREKLGDKVAPADRGRTGLSAVLDADHEFAVGIAMRHVNNNDGAIAHLHHAVELDPGFALAHIQLSDAYWNAHRMADVKAEQQLALKSLDQLGERDRLLALADYYDSTTEEHDRAIATYEQVLAIWPKDLQAESILALAYQGRGDIRMAAQLGARAAKDHPRNVNVRGNYAGFELMTGNFEVTIAEAHKVLAEFSRPTTTIREYLALASFLAGHRDEAVAAYAEFEKAEPSAGAAARADFAIAEGRLHEAESILETGLASDREHKNSDGIEVKSAMLAELELWRGDKQRARTNAAQVTTQPARLLIAATVLIAAGDDKRAAAIQKRWVDDLAPSLRAISKLIEAETLRGHGKPMPAIAVIQDALHLSDAPIGHLMLARAALDARAFSQASTELQAYLARRGEAAVGVDDVATLRYVPLATYYLAKAQEGLGSPDTAKTYAAFLAMQHEPDADDPFVVDARKHVQ